MCYEMMGIIVSEITRIRVAGIWIDDGAILLESLADRDVWSLPGGGLEPGETLKAALVREFREEMDLTVRPGDLLMVVENHFTDEVGGRNREYGYYFRVAPERPFDTPCPIVNSAEPHLKFAWFALEAVPSLTFVPAFLAPMLMDLDGAGLRFVQNTE